MTTIPGWRSNNLVCKEKHNRHGISQITEREREKKKMRAPIKKENQDKHKRVFHKNTKEWILQMFLI